MSNGAAGSPAPTLADGVAAALRDAISKGRLEAGTRLPSAAAMIEAYGVSRTVVREALASLRSEGLIETRKGAGAFVLDPRPIRPTEADRLTLPEVIEMLELRTAVEVEAAALAATRGSPAQHAAILEAMQRMEAADPAASPGLDFAFHAAIARATNNLRFSDFLAGLGTAAVPRSRLALAADATNSMSDYHTQLSDEHAAIHGAIVARDGERARRAMRRHLSEGQSRYQDLLRRNMAAK